MRGKKIVTKISWRAPKGSQMAESNVSDSSTKSTNESTQVQMPIFIKSNKNHQFPQITAQFHKQHRLLIEGYMSRSF